jgi:hypothetical protein
MPAIFQERGFRLFFYSNEGSPPGPVHVHVEKDHDEAKFWLNPTIQLACHKTLPTGVGWLPQIEN